MLTCVNLLRSANTALSTRSPSGASCGSSQGYADLLVSSDSDQFSVERPQRLAPRESRHRGDRSRATATGHRPCAQRRVSPGGNRGKNPHRGGFAQGPLCHHSSAVPVIELSRCIALLRGTCPGHCSAASLHATILLATFPDRDHLNPWQDLIGSCRK